MAQDSPEKHFSYLENYRDIDTWDTKKWQSFCKVLATSLTIIPGVDQRYITYFWNEFGDHDAMSPLQEKGDRIKSECGDSNQQKSSGQASGVSTDPSNDPDAGEQEHRPDKRSSKITEEPITSIIPVQDIQQPSQTPASVKHETLHTSSVEVVDLETLSDSEIRSISRSKNKSFLILVELEGGAQAWCDLHLLRSRKKAVGEELDEVLEEAAENLQNSDVGM